MLFEILGRCKVLQRYEPEDNHLSSLNGLLKIDRNMLKHPLTEQELAVNLDYKDFIEVFKYDSRLHCCKPLKGLLLFEIN